MLPWGAMSVLSDAALVDEAGRPYRWVPCMDAVYAWDEDTECAVQRRAAEICVEYPCPALHACRAKADALGHYATGVWAGEVRGRCDPENADGTVKRPGRKPTTLPDLPPSPILIVA
jgi:hypothetical protein